jgi:monoterpene epsilon-lactone hydrolase
VPSLAHETLRRVIPVLRRSGEVVDPERTRADVLAGQARAHTGPPRRLRGCTVSGLGEAAPPMPFDVGVVVADGGGGSAPPSRTVLYLHGGGYVSGPDAMHWRFAAALAREAGVRVVLPAYPLTPRHTWTDAQQPLLRLFEHLAVDAPGGVTLAGDSAGGGLALALAQRIARSPGPQPTGLVLIAPWVDLVGDTPGTEAAAVVDSWLRLSKLRLYGAWWAGEDDPARPEVSPLHGDFTGLPPMLVNCGTRDLLLPQVRAMVARAREAGCEVEYDEQPGLIHVYPILPVPEARPARRRVVAHLTRPL